MNLPIDLICQSFIHHLKCTIMKTKLFFLAVALFSFSSLALNAHNENTFVEIEKSISIEECASTTHIYPNPFKERFQIRARTTIEEIKLISNEGQEMDIDVSYMINAAIVSVHSGSPGTYIIKIYFRDGGMEQQSIIKQ